MLTDSSFDVSLRIDPTEISVINTTDYGSDGLVFHSYNLSQPYKTVMVSVYPTSVNQSLNVHVQFDEQPTVDDHEYYLKVHVHVCVYAYTLKGVNTCLTGVHLVNYRFQVPSGVSLTGQSPGDDDYELAHMLYIGAANLTSLNASVIHIAVSDAG